MGKERFGKKFSSTNEIESSNLISKDIDDKLTFTTEGRRYFITRRRWGIMTLVCAVLFLDIYGVMFFAFVHDVTSAYFRTDPAVTDLVSTINLLARGLSSIVVATLSGNLNFRSLTMATSGTIFTGSLLVSVAISSRQNFAILIMGQIIGGFAAAIAITLGQMATSNWFPKREYGKAVSGPLLTRRISLVVSNLIATRSLGTSLYDLKHSTTKQEDEHFMRSVGITYSIVYFAIAATAFTAFLCSQLFISDYPPPVDSSDGAKQKSPSWNPLQELKETMMVFKNKLFLLILFHSTLFLAIRPLTDALLSSIVLKGFPNLTDQYAGIMFCVSLTIGAFGSTFGGALLDRFQKPRCTYMGGVLATSFGCGLFSVALHIHSTALMYIGYIMLTFSRDVMLVCISLALVQIMANEVPSTKVRVFSIAGSLPWISPPAYTFVIRKIMDAAGPSIAVLFPIPFLMISGILWVWHYKYFAKVSLPMS